MPGNSVSSPGKPFIANAGKKNDNCKSQIQLNQVIEYLQTIFDPELPVNIYDLGLIYDIKLLENNNIKIKMSLTAPGCPVAGEMPGQVAEKVSQIPDSGLVQVELVWEPAWTKDRMSEDAKMALDVY
jgi:FeS assembly SUF system protein